MQKKLHVAVLCGGQSTEHEISIQSAKNIIEALNPDCYQTSVIFISPQGEWYLLDSPETILQNPDYQRLPENIAAQRLILNLGSPHPLMLLSNLAPIQIDLIFSILHGSGGEDGTMQGLFEVTNIPYVGANTLASAVCMDKAVAKHVLQAVGLPVAKFLVVQQHEASQLHYEHVVEQLGLPLFIKPANTGSSIGISKAKNREDFYRGLELALQYDTKILLEEMIAGREIECAVLGNENPQVALPGEIIPHHEFYTYEAKYLDPNGATLKTPAELTPELTAKIQAAAKKAFSALGCEGMARIDFFLTATGDVYLNEANTLPGFTNISQYPKMWQASGLSYTKLIDQLIHLGLQRFTRNRRLVKGYTPTATPADIL